MSVKPKNILIFILIGLALVFVFFLLSSGGDEAPTLVTSTNTTTASGTSSSASQLGKEAQIAKDFLALLLNVKNITLNDAILSDTAYKSLNDSSILLIHDGSEGRPNPFAPIGTDVFTPTNNSTNLVAPSRPQSLTPTSNTGTKNSISEEDIFSNVDLAEPDLSFEGAEDFAN